ncbi:MAG: nitrogenase-stabilizing/protective protein NifW [Polyangia bacterium]
MGLADELAQVECAEDLFARFGVDFDPRVMVVHRLRVLKRFGVEVRRMETQSPPMNEAERERMYRQALTEAQAQFANPTRSAEPLLPGLDLSLVQIRRHHSGA